MKITYLLTYLPHMPNGISIGPAVFAGYLVVTFQTDRLTDHGNVSSNRRIVYAMHIRCGLIIQRDTDKCLVAWRIAVRLCTVVSSLPTGVAN